MLLVNFSGGKDSSNILIETVKEARRQNVLHRVVAILSDTGAEWNSTADFQDHFVKDLAFLCKSYIPDAQSQITSKHESVSPA